ncbi:MAG TPA: LysR substrate-binding domain-containing protein [Candidatus Dormibacteraeota bacterium]|nr:LysR substrate-binding domain-containing protein [Candidatus Dormibacteraeota bacterium]
MELRHLRYFVAAAEAENVSRAAVKLHLSQPALSRQIHDLEEELGFALFERTAKSIKLTEAGRAFLSDARDLLAKGDEAVHRAKAIATGSREELHIGYAPSPTVKLLPAALRAFQQRASGVRVKLHDLSSEEMLRGVREDKLALAILVRPTKANLRGLRFEELAKEGLCLAVPPNHPFAKIRSVPLAKAAAESFVVFNRADYPDYHEHLQALCASAGARLKIAEEHDSAASLLAAVEAGCGVALVNESMACIAGPRLKFVGISPRPEPLVIGVVWKLKAESEAAQQFVAAAKEAIKTAGAER